MSEFETFNKDLIGKRDQPQITVLRSGIFSLNRAAYGELNSPSAVELLYDREKQMIGIRTVDIHADTAHLVRCPNSSSRGPYLVTAMVFLHYYDIHTNTSKRWGAYLDGDILCLALTAPAMAVSSNRAAHANGELDIDDRDDGRLASGD